MTGAQILAHPLAIPEIRFPSQVAWYRNFLFGPTQTVYVAPISDTLVTKRFQFEVHHLPGHCPGHICLFEPTKGWLFSGDLYIAPDLDSQLADADGPQWIASLDRALALQPGCLFDAHGTILTDPVEVQALLQRKRDFLIALRERIHAAAAQPQSVQDLTRKVFDQRDLINYASFHDGWMALITGSDFSRGNLVKSFLREQRDAAPAASSGVGEPHGA
jgi:glyoxylase-like metal-dependent hydrolase (beta-lactamase superfamily II)